MELNEIYLGNGYELIKEIPEKSIDLVVTDPPYEIKGLNPSRLLKDRKTSYYEEIRDNGLGNGIDLVILDEYVRVLKKINIYIWCNKEQIYDYLTYFVKERGCNWEMIIWSKDNPLPFTNAHYLKDKEYCLFFWEKGVEVKGTYETMKTVYTTNINVKDKKDFGHPTIKPLDIVENLIKNSTSRGGVVLDSFIGSGTTAVACKRLERNFIGFEINPKYYEIAINRIKGITKEHIGEKSILDFMEEQ